MRTGLLVVLAVLVLSMCGVTSAATPAKTVFVAKADAICERSAKRIDVLLDAYEPDDPTSPSTSDADVKAFAPVLEKLIATRRGEIRALRALAAPATVRADWKAALDAYATSTTIVARAVRAARRADRAGMLAALEAAAAPGRRASTLARRVGMTACGNT